MKSGAQNIGSTRSVRGGMSTILLTTLLLLFSYYRCRDKDQVFRNSGLQVIGACIDMWLSAVLEKDRLVLGVVYGVVFKL